MNIVLLSGGSGKRLWPLSNDIRSKQFIKLLKKEDGTWESMMQRVYRQILTANPEATVTIATSKSQMASIQNQLGKQIHISVEPSRRDTFPAIVLAAAYLRDIQQISEQEVMVVCPVDPYVEGCYFSKLIQMEELIKNGNTNLALLGIQPTYPSEKYGYILPESSEVVSEVLAFKEKPDVTTARHYITQGALWNGGVFAFKIGYLLRIAQEMIGFTEYHELYNRYDTLTKISFDYAVVEKEKQIKVVKYEGEWKDIGTWNTLTEAMPENQVGQAFFDEVCENIHVVNELDVPVLCMGLKNVVVAASAEGILVSDKEQSSYIKPHVEHITHRIMFAEKSWGYFRIINVEEDSLTIKITLNPGHAMNYHSHEHRDEVWTVVSGTGKAVIDGEERGIKAGDVICLPVGCKHTILAETELKVIEVQMGKDISVEDKKKYTLEEIENWRREEE